MPNHWRLVVRPQTNEAPGRWPGWGGVIEPRSGAGAGCGEGKNERPIFRCSRGRCDARRTGLRGSIKFYREVR